MPKLKSETILPTPEEDAAITAAAVSDPDAVPLTDAAWEAVRAKVRVGRPPSKAPLKVSTTLRMDPEALARWRASGKGWQTRAAALLAEKAPR